MTDPASRYAVAALSSPPIKARSAGAKAVIFCGAMRRFSPAWAATSLLRCSLARVASRVSNQRSRLSFTSRGAVSPIRLDTSLADAAYMINATVPRNTRKNSGAATVAPANVAEPVSKISSIRACTRDSSDPGCTGTTSTVLRSCLHWPALTPRLPLEGPVFVHNPGSGTWLPNMGRS